MFPIIPQTLLLVLLSHSGWYTFTLSYAAAKGPPDSPNGGEHFGFFRARFAHGTLHTIS